MAQQNKVKLLKRGSKVTMANEDWLIAAAIVRSATDVKYLVVRSDASGRHERCVYPFEFTPAENARCEHLSFIQGNGE